MSTLEDRKIVIKLPSLNLQSFLNLRVFAVALLLMFSSCFAYWYHNIRPFFWLSSAHVEAYSVNLSSDVSGRIAEMGPIEGESVKKGQTLFVLDRDLAIAKQSQAELIVDSLSIQIETEKERIGKAMELYLSATSELELGIGSSDQVKKQLAFMDEAQEKADAAFAKLADAKKELGMIDLQLKKMTNVAPFDGVVLKRTKNPGAVVSFGEAIYTLCDTKAQWIEAEVPESEIGRLSLGTPARIRLTAYPKEELAGKISYIGPATVDRSSQSPISGQKATVPVKISIEDSKIALKPGLSAQVGLKVH